MASTALSMNDTFRSDSAQDAYCSSRGAYNPMPEKAYQELASKAPADLGRSVRSSDEVDTDARSADGDRMAVCDPVDTDVRSSDSDGPEDTDAPMIANSQTGQSVAAETKPATQVQPQQQLPIAPQPSPSLAQALGKAMQKLALQGDMRPDKTRVTPFNSQYAPPLSLCDYLKRIEKFFVCSEACFVSACVLIDRIINMKGKTVVMDSLTAHRLVCTAVVLAAKFNDDTFYSNAYYAKVAGLQVKELNKLEYYFLKAVRWNLIVSPEQYQWYKDFMLEQSK